MDSAEVDMARRLKAIESRCTTLEHHVRELTATLNFHQHHTHTSGMSTPTMPSLPLPKQDAGSPS